MRERGGLDVIRGSFENHNFRQRFGLITMFNVLEHTKNPREVLVKAYSLLEENGLLVLELPYIFTVQSLMTFRRWHHFEETHNWFFNRHCSIITGIS
jgi:2-polyprenyl-3-methyl-5-hydroxy-6-metoxy-1,4-benzoquinol methylase